ncbi:hypothetical protein [Hwangdonia seohaensis]|uniref:Lipocalin-like domain-containing protein n=1 Tax=Hwangdonia seohaensis TaxID=1240727 RepID=A0ABW3R7A2_9FLAO|nr:hypothetical protein [Hwangdonia seohaensis]
MKNTCLLIFALALLILGCGKEGLPIDPKKDILGKWELIQQGTSLENLFDVDPNGYTEFIDETSYRFYNYQTEEFDDGDYTLNDSSLTFFYYAVENGQVVDTIPVKYFYTFKDHKTLVLDIDASAIFRTFIYKKID